MYVQFNDCFCVNEVIGGNYFGFVIVYMVKVNDVKMVDGVFVLWFKVDEFGYDVGSKIWGIDIFNKNCGKWMFKIFSKIFVGDYFVRVEVIVFYIVGLSGGVQFYMSCYQVRVVNSGSGQFFVGVRFLGVYSVFDCE